MKSTGQSKKQKAKRIWIPLIVILLIAAGAVWLLLLEPADGSCRSALLTPASRPRRCAKAVLPSPHPGQGRSSPGRSSSLGFSTSGTVAKLNVEVGDVVKQGDVLAVLANLTQLQASVNTAQQDLISVAAGADHAQAEAPPPTWPMRSLPWQGSEGRHRRQIGCRAKGLGALRPEDHRCLLL